MPSPRTTSKAALAPSSTDSSGKSRRYSAPVSGFTEAGPVEPLQLPSEFTHTTNQRSVSIGLPGPSIGSHQPSAGLPGVRAACASGDSPVTISTALSRRSFNVPQVSYATRAPCSAPPRFMRNGEGRGLKRVPGGMNSVIAAV